MAKLIATRGLPASGKTTWAKRHQADDASVVLVSKDDIRAMLHGSKWSRDNEKQVLRIRDDIVKDALGAGRDVIVHDTNGKPAHIDALQALASFYGAEFEVKSFVTPVEECVTRDQKRPNAVGRAVIERMAYQFPDLLGLDPKTLPWQTYTMRPKGQRFFTSDLHLGHDKNAEWRGYMSTQAMNDDLMEKWRRTITDDDEVFVLGDAAMGKRTESVPLYGELPGKKYLVPGNHDHCGPWNPKAMKLWDLYSSVFTILSPIYDLWLSNGEQVTLCHFPYGNLDHTEEPRYMEYRPPQEGKWLLHGHTHAKDIHQGPQMVHIGVDAWGMYPVTEDEIIQHMDGRCYENCPG